jgi:hypothetical protein
MCGKRRMSYEGRLTARGEESHAQVVVRASSTTPAGLPQKRCVVKAST